MGTSEQEEREKEEGTTVGAEALERAVWALNEEQCCSGRLVYANQTQRTLGADLGSISGTGQFPGRSGNSWVRVRQSQMPGYLTLLGSTDPPLLGHFLVGKDGSEGFPGFWICFVE